MAEILTEAEPHQVLNVDETKWRVADTGEYTWAPTGSEGVTVYTPTDEKSGFTTLATIDLTGKKYPLSLIAKGKTEQVEASWFGGGRNIMQPGEKEPLINSIEHSSRRSSQELFYSESLTDHSESGWTTQPTWNHYLYNLRFNWCTPFEGIDFYAKENRVYLLCDSFPVHFSKESLDLAKELNIQLVKIPEGTTDIFQPLDCRIFGALKNHSRTFMNTKIITELFAKYDLEQAMFIAPVKPQECASKQEAVVVLEKAYNDLSVHHITQAWNDAILKYYEISSDGIYLSNEYEIDKLLNSDKFVY